MRRPLTALAAAAVAAAVGTAAVAVGAGGALADITVPLPSATVTVPAPSVPAPPLPTSAPVPPVPVPSVPAPTSGGPGGGTGGSGGPVTSPTTGKPGRGGGSGADAVPAGTGLASTPPGARSRAVAERRRSESTASVAGTARARDLVDDESSPQLRRAGEAYLSADQGIAEIARQKTVMARLRQDAAATAQLYRAMGYDVAGAQRAATAWHQHDDRLPAGTRASERRVVEDTSTRADERVGDLVVAREQVRADFVRISSRYREAKLRLADADARVSELAAQRSSALSALQAAQAGDAALAQARLAESGRLGAQIESLSEQLARRGDTVPGTGSFVHPLAGAVTSPYGMRYHPILHYTKLHTGTDFAGGSIIRAADDGRVLMAVLSTAYGNFTVVDHGVIDGRRVTTAYAHQARALVAPGDVVRKGDPIGIVGQTGYATGPHLHFEVRENGTVVDPMVFLARH